MKARRDGSWRFMSLIAVSAAACLGVVAATPSALAQATTRHGGAATGTMGGTGATGGGSTGTMGATGGASITNEQFITIAQSAAPSGVSEGATIAINENGKLRTLREGSNGWTCLPSFPQGGAQAAGGMTGKPICVDRNGLDWIQAWLDHKDPPANKISAAYMLQGVSASESNPYAQGSEQADWIQAGPHVMILGARALREGLSASVGGEQQQGVGQSNASGRSTAQNWKTDTTRPFVMWQGTPYEHLMIPIQ